jgi:hypothetical protein
MKRFVLRAIWYDPYQMQASAQRLAFIPVASSRAPNPRVQQGAALDDAPDHREHATDALFLIVRVYVGVDASVKRDSTALVAVSFDKKTQMVRLVQHRWLAEMRRTLRPNAYQRLVLNGSRAAAPFLLMTYRRLCG